MKKILSILSAILVIAAMFHISVARHYCGGVVVATKISLTGKLASCGMETKNENCPFSGYFLKTRCCENNIIVYSIDNTFTLSNFKYSAFKHFFSDSFTKAFSVILIDKFFSASGYSVNDPPESLLTSDVVLSKICIFRI